MNKPLVRPCTWAPMLLAMLLALDGELGALGDGPLRGIWNWRPASGMAPSASRSPWRSLELNLRRRKFMPVEKFSLNLENDILLVFRDRRTDDVCAIHTWILTMKSSSTFDKIN